MSKVIAVKKVPYDYEPILNYYNDRRPEGSNALEELDRMEGGFKIRLPETSEYGDDPDCKNSSNEMGSRALGAWIHWLHKWREKSIV